MRNKRVKELKKALLLAAGGRINMATLRDAKDKYTAYNSKQTQNPKLKMSKRQKRMQEKEAVVKSVMFFTYPENKPIYNGDTYYYVTERGVRAIVCVSGHDCKKGEAQFLTEEDAIKYINI